MVAVTNVTSWQDLLPRRARPAGPGGGEALGRRAEDLLEALTLAEKIGLLHQFSPGVPRLGVAAFRTGTEALHGAAWLGRATVFPQAVGLGATWDPELAAAVGEAAAREVRALHGRDPLVSLNVWAPVVNLLRDPRWGRNEEGYSEDPLLTAALALAYCRGLRGGDPLYLRTAPLLKHFLAYNNEDGRDTTSSGVRPRVLHEYDTLPFRAPIEADLAVGVMPAYNLVNGRPCHVSPLLSDLVRSWSGGELIVCSDAHAPSNLVDSEHYFDDHAAGHAAALRAGVDSFTDHGADSGVMIGRITEALRRGLITRADVDRAVRRLLLVRFRLGEFDPAADPFTEDGSVLACPEHAALARRAATAAIVVLKNDGGLLPLPATGRVAVVGPLANMLCEDWYSGTMPYRVTVADGIRAALRSHGEVTVAEGVDTVALHAGPGSVGMAGEHLRVGAAAQAARFEVFDFGGGVVALRSAATGLFVTVSEEDSSLTARAAQPNGWVVRETFVVEQAPETATAAGASGSRSVLLRSAASGDYVRLADGAPASGDGGPALLADAGQAAAQRFGWELVTDGGEAAARVAAGADVAVVVVGSHPLINGRETLDRRTLALPAAQDRLVRAVRAAQARAVLLVMSSYPYSIGWADEHLPAIAWTCHGGQETGHAVADVLFGAAEPAGRLPQTWPASDADLPPMLDYDIITSRRTYLYSEAAPLYPFGHGLGYTSFGYSGLRVTPDTAGPGDTVTVTLTVTNTGPRPGVETAQVYLRACAPWPPRPRRELRGFARVSLAPGESATVSVPLPVASLAYWDVAAHRMTVGAGEYEVMAGRSAAAIEQVARLTVAGDPPGPRPLCGVTVAAADFDECGGIALVDADPVSGDAVTTAGAEPGWIMLHAADLGPAAGGEPTLTARVAREEPGGAVLEAWCGAPGAGRLLGAAEAGCTGGRYSYADVTLRLAPVEGVHDVYLVLRGSQRLVSVRVERGGGR
jgi:beta-glucosidase